MDIANIKPLLTLNQAIEDTHVQLKQAQVYCGHGTDNVWDEAVFLTLGACGLPLDTPQTQLEKILSPSQREQLDQWLYQRTQKRIPLPYLLGFTWFADVQIKVKPEVIIPRSPIAELILSGFKPLLKNRPQQALDLCCGSGCIGIALALQMAIPQVDMADIAPAALALAQDNVDMYQLNQQVKVIHSDLFNALPVGKNYDLIVSNPPYVNHDDFTNKPQEFDHEPALALVSGEDGLDITAAILAQAAQWLSPQGVLVLEVGNSEAALQSQLPQTPFLWIDLSAGGNGILALTYDQCQQWQGVFKLWQQQRTALVNS